MMRWPLPNVVERVVVNTGLLITLGRAGALAVVEQLPRSLSGFLGNMLIYKKSLF